MSSLLRPKSAYMCLDDLNISNFLLLTTQISPDWSGASHISNICTRTFNMKIESMLYSVHNAIQQTLYPSYLMSRHVFLAHCCCNKRPRQEKLEFDFTGHSSQPKSSLLGCCGRCYDPSHMLHFGHSQLFPCPCLALWDSYLSSRQLRAEDSSSAHRWRLAAVVDRHLWPL